MTDTSASVETRCWGRSVDQAGAGRPSFNLISCTRSAKRRLKAKVLAIAGRAWTRLSQSQIWGVRASFDSSGCDNGNA